MPEVAPRSAQARAFSLWLAHIRRDGNILLLQPRAQLGLKFVGPPDGDGHGGSSAVVLCVKRGMAGARQTSSSSWRLDMETQSGSFRLDLSISLKQIGDVACIR